MKAVCAAPAAALLVTALPALASTNPDTPTKMTSNVVIGAMRLTIRPNSDGASVYAAINGNAQFYGKRHPTLRVQLDGAVQLSETAKPMKI